MSYRVQWTNRFKKDYKLCESRGLDMTLIDKVIELLSATGSCRGNIMTIVLQGNGEDSASVISSRNG